MEISTLNYKIDDDSVLNTYFDDTKTLLDSDIVICSPPSLDKTWDYEIKKNSNKLYLLQPTSLKLIEEMTSKKREIETLLENGKVIVCFMNPPVVIRCETNNRNSYKSVSNYSFLPVDEYPFLNSIKRGEGQKSSNLKLVDSKNPFAQFYHAFKDKLKYYSYFDENTTEKPEYFIQNKSNKGVALLLKVSQGYVVFIPNVLSDSTDSKFLRVIIACTKKMLSKKDTTATPKWVDKLQLTGEDTLIAEKARLKNEVEQLENSIFNIEGKIKFLNLYKRLLYEQGEELENAVLSAFQLLGFKVNRRKEKDMEHDVVFESEEGRGIAEVEGKDKNSINISKLSQLIRVVHEDFSINGEYPQGVLIGNHYRLTEPSLRKEPFTERVITAAKRNHFGLLDTVELYKAVERILKEEPDNEEFKSECRKKILDTQGSLIKLI